MKLICPYCFTEKPTTLREVQAGKPIYCPNCHQDIHLSATKLTKKGGTP